jgi:hypothetical protein
MKMTGHNFISFLQGLSPLYTHDHVNGLVGARSLEDGTLILPFLDEDESMEEEWITIWWQGDQQRSSDVQAIFYISHALMRHCQFHCTGKSSKTVLDMYEGLARHFTFKTGQSLMLPEPH